MTFCSKCGSANPDDAMYCNKCGALLMATEQAAPAAPSPSAGAPVPPIVPPSAPAASPSSPLSYEDYQRMIEGKNRPPRAPRPPRTPVRHKRLVIAGVIALMIVMILAAVLATNPILAEKLIESNGLQDGKYLTYQVTDYNNGQVERSMIKITFDNVTDNSLTEKFEMTGNGQTLHDQVTLTRSGDTWTDSVTGQAETAPMVLGEDRIGTIYGQKTVDLREYDDGTDGIVIEWDNQDNGLTYKALLVTGAQSWMVMELSDTNIGEIM